MNKRNNYIGLLSILLVIAFTLTGCGENQELQQKYNLISTQYSELEKDYNELKSSYTKLKKKYNKIQDLPNIVVSLVDDRNEVVDLTLYSSLRESQKAYTKYYYELINGGFNRFNVTITCNNGEKIDDIYWVDADGKIRSYMDNVSNLENTYTLQIFPNCCEIQSLIIKSNGKNVYTSFCATFD